METQKIIEDTQQYVMNTYGRIPIALVEGSGVMVWDSEGKKYLDFLSGIAVNALGHCPPTVVEAIHDQAQKLMHCSNLYHIELQGKLAKFLVKVSDLDKVFFCNSGAEANEAAIKLTRKYAKLTWGTEKYEIITMEKSFHGRTLAAITATGQPKYHQGFEPLPTGFKYVPFKDLKALKEAITPNTCAIMLEPIQGEGGVNVPDLEYIQGVKKLCTDNNLLLIFDEVQTGVGRTGKPFGYQHFGVMPDIITMAKALGGGFPIGAMLATDAVAKAFQPGDHASTFGGNPLACAAALATVETMVNQNIIDKVQKVGAYFMYKLKELQQSYSFIIDVRGKGLMLGMELSVDGGQIVASCQKKGLLINCIGGKVLRFVPPLIITESQIDEALQILKRAFEEVEV